MDNTDGTSNNHETAGAAGEPPSGVTPGAGEPPSGVTPAAGVRPAAAPAARQRGLRAWMWLPVAGFAALSITGAVVSGFMVGGSIVDQVNAGRVAALPAPTASATDLAAPTTEPEPGELEAGALITLDEQVDIGSTFPIWGFPMQSGWEIVTFDQAGINQSENAELGCLFTTSQNKQPAYDLDATADLSDTLATIDTLEQQLLGAGNEATLVGELGGTDFGINLADADERIEFMTTRVDYLNPEVGVSYTSEIAGRAMPLAESFMYVVVSCPTALVDAGGSPFEELRAGLAVVVETAP